MNLNHYYERINNMCREKDECPFCGSDDVDWYVDEDTLKKECYECGHRFRVCSG